jgi:AraC family transcriptional regulator of adaptative response/methylated-DNA-[protein]-cysteine methyltransferase
MNLMISETAPHLTRRTADSNAAVETISFATGHCALGQVLVARSIKGVCAILIGADQYALQADLAGRFPKARLVANEPVVHEDLTKVTHFVDKPAEGLYLPLDLRGTLFQRRVWEKLRAIPIGRTATYTDVAHSIGKLSSARAAAGASNPIAPAVPCHRVVRSNGDLAGYRWGIERKRELIRKEAAA